MSEFKNLQERQYLEPQNIQDFQKDVCQAPKSIYAENNQKIINQIDIDDKKILIATNLGLQVHNLRDPNFINMKIIEGSIWEACFIPKTNYVAYCLGNTLKSKDQRKNLYIFSLKQQKIAARVKIQDDIQYIRPSKSCIALGSLRNIYVLHFPSLKPIYNGPAGNGIRIVFDLSIQGLTIAHDSSAKGELMIRNFTNIKKNHEITERKRSILSFKIKQKNQRMSQDTIMTRSIQFTSEEVEPLLKVNAHIDMISQIKMAPNGAKAVTASVKGTVLRIFSTKNGTKLEEFRVGYELVQIVNISFVPDGNIIGCMNSKGIILLFNVSMDKQQKQYQNQRLGHNVYTQSNPKSFFSFLSFLYPPLDDSYSFNRFQLINPQFKEETQESKSPYMDKSFSRSENVEDDPKYSFRKQNNSIQELDEQHHEEISTNKIDLNIMSVNSQSLFSQENSFPKQLSRFPQKVTIKAQMQRSSLKISPPDKESSLLNSVKRASQQKISRTYSVQSINRHLSSAQKKGSIMSQKNFKLENEKVFRRPFYNTVSQLHITQANYVWAVKGYHLFGLKYDAFHGGEMILDQSKKIQ